MNPIINTYKIPKREIKQLYRYLNNINIDNHLRNAKNTLEKIEQPSSNERTESLSILYALKNLENISEDIKDTLDIFGHIVYFWNKHITTVLPTTKEIIKLTVTNDEIPQVENIEVETFTINELQTYVLNIQNELYLIYNKYEELSDIFETIITTTNSDNQRTRYINDVIEEGDDTLNYSILRLHLLVQQVTIEAESEKNIHFFLIGVYKSSKPENETILTHSIKEQDLAMINLLTKYDADVRVANSDGESPFTLAEQLKNIATDDETRELYEEIINILNNALEIQQAVLQSTYLKFLDNIHTTTKINTKQIPEDIVFLTSEFLNTTDIKNLTQTNHEIRQAAIDKKQEKENTSLQIKLSFLQHESKEEHKSEEQISTLEFLTEGFGEERTNQLQSS